MQITVKNEILNPKSHGKVVSLAILPLLDRNLLLRLSDMLMSGSHVGFRGVVMVIHAYKGQK